jgi:hypothetical protein
MHSAADAAPAKYWKAITTSDTVNLPAGCRGIYVGGAGNIVLVGSDDVSVTLTAVPVGTFVPCGPKRVGASSTATLMIALF